MRVAFFAWESLHSVSVGGVAAHVTELSVALRRRRHEVHNFVRLGEGQRTYDVVDGVHYHRCPIDLNPDFVTEMNNMGNSFVYSLGETEAHRAHGSTSCTDTIGSARRVSSRPRTIAATARC